MKRIYVVMVCITMLFSVRLQGQETITLIQCYEWTKENYPMIRQYDLIRRTEQYNLANAAKGWLPQIGVNAKATYQSDVTKIPWDADTFSSIIPGFEMPVLSKDQYQVIAEVNQPIWDGGMIRYSKELTRAQATADKKQLDSDLYALNQRVNQVYFGSLLQDELLRQNELLQGELHVNIDRIEAMIANGVANQSDKESLEVELLNAIQQEIELTASRTAYRQMLGVLTGKAITEETVLLPPPLPVELSGKINRPELKAFEARSNLLEIQNLQLKAGIMPNFGVFVQGGYGKPGLNMFENSFEPFYIAGVRMSWNIANFYTLRNDRRKIETNRLAVDLQRESFLFNTELDMVQQNTDIRKMTELIKSDQEIIRLRTSIKEAAEVKLENGVISVTDLIREINAEDQAKQAGATHRIQQLMSVYNYLYTTNNNESL
ncbi:MAG: TolC family protein [Tannerellaceae bacterium]|nr:TolC family protein [Tannerellaceae bacterium]